MNAEVGLEPAVNLHVNIVSPMAAKNELIEKKSKLTLDPGNCITRSCGNNS